MENADDIKKNLLATSHTIAVVGLSPDQEKASNVVANYLIANNFRVIPVNPGYPEILGQKCYPSLADIPEEVDIVDIFMRSEKVLPVVIEAIQLKPKAIWLQLGIVDSEAKELAEANNILFYMNQCIKQEHTRLFSK
ncbi:MAG: CoA-binding domain protein [Deltaproteobacteria bacterium]|nr:CoA-binding domain protein [Deltaproteobacteria bacterium]